MCEISENKGSNTIFYVLTGSKVKPPEMFKETTDWLVFQLVLLGRLVNKQCKLRNLEFILDSLWEDGSGQNPNQQYDEMK